MERIIKLMDWMDDELDMAEKYVVAAEESWRRKENGIRFDVYIHVGART